LKKKTMRLVLCLVLLVAMLATGMPAMASPRAAASETLIIDGKTASVPVTVVGRASLVQVRALAETFGTVPQWDNKEKIASFTAAGKNIQVFAGQGRVAVDGKEIKAATRILRGRVFVELAPIKEVLGIGKATRTIASGTFTGEARGYGGMLRVEIKTADNKITAVRVVEQRETAGIADPALTRIPQSIVRQQSLAIDAVTGATLTSRAILDAAAQAVTKAKGNVSEWLRPVAAAPVAPGQPAAVRKQTDVVVIGGGGAGLAAAVSAAEAGAKVILIEKMPMLGGNTLRATGGMQAAGTRFQTAAGINDTPDIHYADTMRGGGNINNPRLVRIMVDNANNAMEWLTSLGVSLSRVSVSGGSTNLRGHGPAGGFAAGPPIVQALEKEARNRGINILLDTRATEIIVDSSGRAVGVRAASKELGDLTITARAVVLAAGGFGANLEMVAQYNPALRGFDTNNHPGATGDGIKLATAIGAATIHMEHIQTHPTVVPKTGVLITERVRGAGAILVNRSGVRFVDELQTRDAVSRAILEQEGDTAFLIFDRGLRAEVGVIEDYVRQGLVREGNTLEEVAAKIGLPAGRLTTTMQRYNELVTAGSDADFGKRHLLRRLEVGPFFAIEVAPAIHHTMGGVVINEQTQVIDRNGRVIPGLFAAGEVTGGIHGNNRLGGNAVTDITVFGRIAGKSAADSR